MMMTTDIYKDILISLDNLSAKVIVGGFLFVDTPNRLLEFLETVLGC